MTAIRLYLDEDAMRRAFVFALRARGVDVLTAAEGGMVNQSDEAHLEMAAGLSRVLYSYNTADYCQLHESWLASGRSHAGIIVATQQRYPISEELRRLMRLMSRVGGAEIRDRLEFLSSWA